MANTSSGLRVLAVAGALAGTAITLAGYGYASIVLVNGQAPAWTTVGKACEQPDSVSYDGASYEVYVRRTTFRLALFGRDDDHAVIGRAGAKDAYGVWVELNSGADPDRLTCRWTPDAVELTESTGIVHTVPASVFTGGR